MSRFQRSLSKLILTLLIICWQPLASCQSPQKPIIIDTDMASEDWLGMIYLLSSPQADVKAITVSGTGEAHCGPGVKNALKLVNTLKHDYIPVSCGREQPGYFGHRFPATWRVAMDLFLPVELYGPIGTPYHQSAAQLMIDSIKMQKAKSTLVVLGPLTNLADAIAKDPSIIPMIEKVFVMGGALEVPGNIHTVTDIPNEVAEWNLFVDPVSAQFVFQSGVKITLVPLDATRHVPINPAFIQTLKAQPLSPNGMLFTRVIDLFSDEINSQQWHFWDTLTSVAALHPEVLTTQNQTIGVKISPTTLAGQTVNQPGTRSIDVAVNTNTKQFEKLLFDSLKEQSIQS